MSSFSLNTENHILSFDFFKEGTNIMTMTLWGFFNSYQDWACSQQYYRVFSLGSKRLMMRVLIWSCDKHTTSCCGRINPWKNEWSDINNNNKHKF
jgi:hypothetical protein